MDRTEFGQRQAEMTARWADGVRRRTQDAETYFEGRRRAYLARWGEATRFIPDGSRVLDIGGGNLFESLFDYLKSRDFDYWYFDVDPAAVESSRRIGVGCGFEADHFRRGFNDNLEFESSEFDAVFSSHSLEHSFHLQRTFSEVARVLRPDGMLLMAVPLGWELSLEHPYFLNPNEWIAIVEDAGFKVRVAQIGREYPEKGEDLFIAARKNSSPKAGRQIDPEKYAKGNFTFVPFDSPTLSYHGPWLMRADHAIGLEKESRLEIQLPAEAREILPILGRHDWSGTASLRWGEESAYEDLYSWFSFVQPMRLERGLAAGSATLEVVGRNKLSRASQLVVYGVMHV